MNSLQDYQVWFITGSQHLYGPKTLDQVAENSRQIVAGLNDTGSIPVQIVFKPVLTTREAIRQVCLEANSSDSCVGLVTWMHTFSPAKMWIAGLTLLRKPFLHLHTQFNREIPWAELDMDFMNLNQSAHGDREFGFICTRMGLNRKVVVGHWTDMDVQESLGTWARAACAWHDAQGMKIARFGDNMRDVAVTEGDKVEAQARLGYAVYGYGVGDLVATIEHVSDTRVAELLGTYDVQYQLMPSLKEGSDYRSSLAIAAKIEIGMRDFLQAGEFQAFTTTFEDLHGLPQLPGLAVQRLMAEGYGFGAEGDWKTAALVRSMKVMSTGLEGGTSFMEDYTYHYGKEQDKVLGAHMLEVCPSIAEGQPSLQIHPLGIGGKADPARLVFDTRSGPAVNATVLDMGNRFRMVVNEVDVIPTDEPLPNLPVARALWIPRPNLKVAAASWILAGGAHHTGFSQAVTTECLYDFAEMADMEFLVIDQETSVKAFKKELLWNEQYYAWARNR
jgi:L-arabinose isomerase